MGNIKETKYFLIFLLFTAVKIFTATPEVIFAQDIQSPETDKSDFQLPDVLGESGRGDGQFFYPRGIAVDANRNIYVVDRTGRIQCFDPNGQLLRILKCLDENKQGPPVGLAINSNNDLFVADLHNSRILVYSTEGKLLRKFGSFGGKLGQFVFPVNIATCKKNQIYVCEVGGNDRITVFDPNAKPIKVIGSHGCKEGQLRHPLGIRIGQQGNIYVADSHNNRICVFDHGGKYLWSIGSKGNTPGKLRLPSDVELLDNGELLVLDSGNNRIQRFDHNGNCIGLWGKPGSKTGQLANTSYLALFDRGHVLVTDSGNNRIQCIAINEIKLPNNKHLQEKNHEN